MESDVESASSTAQPSGIVDRAVFWVLVEGNRLVVAAGIIVLFVLAVWVLFTSGVIHIGADSSAPSLFASGLTAGVITLVTIALSVNQLILSRVFGSPHGLSERLNDSRAFRQSIEEMAGVPSSPNDPAAFLSLLARTLDERATILEESIVESSWSPPEETLDVIRDISDYGDGIEEDLEEKTDIVDVLYVVLGTTYAKNLAAIHHVENDHNELLSEDLQADFNAVEELLESIAIARQFFKTLVLQQDFARLSRYMVYTGLVGLLATITLTLIFRTNAVTIPGWIIYHFVSVGLGFVVAPLAVFTSFVLRAAVIAEKTVSVGPFVSPSQD